MDEFKLLIKLFYYIAIWPIGMMLYGLWLLLKRL